MIAQSARDVNILMHGGRGVIENDSRGSVLHCPIPDRNNTNRVRIFGPSSRGETENGSPEAPVVSNA